MSFAFVYRFCLGFMSSFHPPNKLFERATYIYELARVNDFFYARKQRGTITAATENLIMSISS